MLVSGSCSYVLELGNLLEWVARNLDTQVGKEGLETYQSYYTSKFPLYRKACGATGQLNEGTITIGRPGGKVQELQQALGTYEGREVTRPANHEYIRYQFGMVPLATRLLINTQSPYVPNARTPKIPDYQEDELAFDVRWIRQRQRPLSESSHYGQTLTCYTPPSPKLLSTNDAYIALPCMPPLELTPLLISNHLQA